MNAIQQIKNEIAAIKDQLAALEQKLAELETIEANKAKETESKVKQVSKADELMSEVKSADVSKMDIKHIKNLIKLYIRQGLCPKVPMNKAHDMYRVLLYKINNIIDIDVMRLEDGTYSFTVANHNPDVVEAWSKLTKNGTVSWHKVALNLVLNQLTLRGYTYRFITDDKSMTDDEILAQLAA